MRRLTILVVLVAFVFSCGGQWAVLQGVAWANMLREYSQTVPFTKAVQMTFSGEYPCDLCKAIEEKRQSESTKMAAFVKAEKKIVAQSLVVSRRFTVITQQVFIAHDFSLVTRSDAPDVPPPRCV